MPTITSIGPLLATRGASGTLITITGTGFGASQGAGTCNIGGVAAIVAGWADTEITCRADDDPATPLGSQDVAITPDGGSAVTAEDGIYVYDDTDAKDYAKLDEGIADQVFLDGEQIGFTSGPLDMTFRTRSLEYEPADRFDVVQDWTHTALGEVRLTLNQLHKDGAKLAKILGGAFDAVSGIISVAGNTEYAEHSLAVLEAGGAYHVFKRVKITGDVTFTLDKTPKAWPVTFKVLSLNSAGAKKYECYLL